MTSNIIIGGLRISALTEVAYGRDVTYGIGPSLIWAIAQIGTGTIVACCPHLRPLFEKVLPHRFVRVPTRKSTPQHTPWQKRQASITVTTSTFTTARRHLQSLPLFFMMDIWSHGHQRSTSASDLCRRKRATQGVAVGVFPSALAIFLEQRWACMWLILMFGVWIPCPGSCHYLLHTPK
jgi:hypothetical protein